MRRKAICDAATLVTCCRVEKYKDVKVLWGWMAPRRVVGVWAWSSLLLLLLLLLVEPNQPKVRAAHCSLLLLPHAPADEDYNLFA